MKIIAQKIYPTVKPLLSHPLFLPFSLFLFIAVINIFLQPSFFQFRIIRSNVLTFTPLMLVSAGQAIIILSGDLDLSVGTGISLINCILANTMSADNPVGSALLALALGFAAAMAMGATNGILVGYLRLPSLITTFATAAVWFGLALFLRPQPGGYITPWVSKFNRLSIGFISMSLLIVIGSLLLWRIIRSRRLGRYIYAIGSDEEAAFDSGINTSMVKALAYTLGWVFVFLASFSITAQMSSGDAYMGNPFALNSIAAVVIGGVSLAGGRGHILGAVFGALTLSLVINIIYYANIGSIFQEFVKGAIIMIALSMTIVYKQRIG